MLLTGCIHIVNDDEWYVGWFTCPANVTATAAAATSVHRTGHVEDEADGV